MNSFAAVVVILALLAVHWDAAHAQCVGSAASCSSVARIRIRVNGPGSCSGSASANCVALAANTNACVRIFDDIVSNNVCLPEDAEAAGKCIAAAFAAAFAEAAVQIQCAGSGVGCGYANGNGAAFACSFVAVLARAIATVTGGNLSSECISEVEALSGVFAFAAAEAHAAACAQNGFNSDFDSEFAIRAECIAAKALATCWADCENAIAGGVASVFSCGSVSLGDGPSAGGGFPLPPGFNPFGGR